MHALLPLLLTSPTAQAALVVDQTHVTVDITGPVAELTISQNFINTNTEFIEGVYRFPLHEDAAVDGMVMRIGDREIRSEIHPREEAREIYEEAVENGQSAALTEQERANVFTQSVANIPPGEEIQVLLHVVQPLTYEDGVYRFDFPLVVGPRFVDSSVADPERIATHTSPAPVAHRVDFEIYADVGLPLEQVWSPSHSAAEIELRRGEAEIYLDGARLDRDFVVELDPAGDEPQVAMLTQDGHFGLLFEPQETPEDSEIVPRELIFVVDNSCSMSGTPMDMSKAAMRQALEGLLPEDTFQVMRFSEDVSGLSPVPLPATPENIQRGLDFVDAMEGMGPTDMLAGIEAALAFPHSEERERIICFMTDGYIGSERDIFAAIEDGIGDARLFSFGIGSSVNRYLLDRMASVGRGDVSYVLLDDMPEDAVDTFYERIARPVLTDIEIDWGGMQVEGVYPQRTPDLFVGQSLTVWGRYTGAPSEVTVRGRVGGGRFEQVVQVEELDGGGIASAWARARIKDLELEQLWGEDEDITQEIVETALRYRLMSQHTSFVAVEYKVINPEGAPLTLNQDTETPAGVSYEKIAGSELSRRHMRPGDPLLTVSAPADAQVIAVFPWGDVEILRWDLVRDRWYHRFLVPREVEDGEVEIQIFVHHTNGEIEVRSERLMIDAGAPELWLEAEGIESGTLLRLYPEEPLRSLHVYPPGHPEERIRIDMRAEEFRGEDVIELVIPGQWEELVVVAKDLALNRLEQMVEVSGE